MQSVEREARSMQGMLIKRGDRWMKRWVRRWVSLELDTEVRWHASRMPAGLGVALWCFPQENSRMKVWFVSLVRYMHMA